MYVRSSIWTIARILYVRLQSERTWRVHRMLIGSPFVNELLPRITVSVGLRTTVSLSESATLTKSEWLRVRRRNFYIATLPAGTNFSSCLERSVSL